MNTVIKVENISKQYRLGQVGTGSLAHDLNRFWHTIRGKDDPYLKIGETNDRSKSGISEYVWALKDINFEVKHGEVMGIIGRNGAGKSTLLKILSRTTAPTTGSVKIKGRVASLLEVGTGFHPELSGRDNIFLNGAILGMTKQEIKKKFDEIVDFAGVERYIDTPVKRYSSGMYVRLAFAVAAHLEPEILIVDEVLAVGDAEFQKKALGKMQDVSKNEGRTVLFVSHNMASMQNLCSHGILLINGQTSFEGTIQNTINEYQDSSRKSTSFVEFKSKSFKSESNLMIKYIKLLDPKTNQLKSSFKMGEDFLVEVKICTGTPVENIGINIRMNDQLNNQIAGWRSHEVLNDKIDIQNELVSRTLVKSLNVFDGLYNLSFAVMKGNEKLDYIENAISFEIIPHSVEIFGKVISKSYNLIYTPSEWEFENF